MLQSITSKWNINNKIHIVLREYTLNIKTTCNDTNLLSESCLIHTLQLVISDLHAVQIDLQNSIDKVSKIVGYFNHSPLACTNIKMIQKEFKLPEYKMVKNVKTRWDSMYYIYMVECFIEQKKCISFYCTENNITNLSANEWNILEAYLQLLKPFEQIIKSMRRNESIISECIPSITALDKNI